jgi:hypothetical protein
MKQHPGSAALRAVASPHLRRRAARRRLALAALAASVGAGACSDDPADIAGAYTASITARDNGCNLAAWTEGASATSIPVTITQTGARASADVGGLSQVALDLALGGHVFGGEVDGSSFALRLVGSRALMMGNCAYTLNGDLEGRLTGDSIAGRLNFTAATNDNPDCAPLKACVSFQEFAASRPPR